MADRTSAGLFGEMFKLLDELNPPDKHQRALKIWELSKDYDFSPYQMNADETLTRLGLAYETQNGVVYRDSLNWDPDRVKE